MTPALRDAIEKNYGFHLKECSNAPPGGVTQETYVLRDDAGHGYFCKVLDRPYFISIVLPTLPVLREMKDKGISRIAAPVPAREGLSFRHEGKLVVLFDLIEGQSSRDYDLKALGGLLGEIHAITPHLGSSIPALGFSTMREKFFTEELPRIACMKTDDRAILALQEMLRRHEKDTQAYIDAFFRLAEKCGKSKHEFVNTHGDVMGNVMASPDGIYIIDWDEMESAPAERDLWIFADRPEFMAGYRRARPGFTPDPDALKHAVLKNHLEGIPIFMERILDMNIDTEARLQHVQLLESKRMPGWRKPLLDAAIKNN